MEKTRLSSKGQLIIPKAVRDAHGWGEGTEFTVEDTKDGIVLNLWRRTCPDGESWFELPVIDPTRIGVPKLVGAASEFLG